MTADGYVLNAPAKNVYALVISAKGATEGDVVMLRDGGPTGTIRLYCTIPTDNDTITIPLGRYGINFVKDIYYSEQATAGSKIRTTVVWD